MRECISEKIDLQKSLKLEYLVLSCQFSTQLLSEKAGIYYSKYIYADMENKISGNWNKSCEIMS